MSKSSDAAIVKRRMVAKMYQDALDSQTACNLSGLVKSLDRCLNLIWEESKEAGEKGGTEFVNTHPVVKMFVTQMLHLSMQQAADFETWHEAYLVCEQKAKDAQEKIIEKGTVGDPNQAIYKFAAGEQEPSFPCPKCGKPILYSYAESGHGENTTCPHCGQEPDDEPIDVSQGALYGDQSSAQEPVQDAEGNTVPTCYREDDKACQQCKAVNWEKAPEGCSQVGDDTPDMEYSTEECLAGKHEKCSDLEYCNCKCHQEPERDTLHPEGL